MEPTRRGGSCLQCLESSDTEVSCFPKAVAGLTMAKAKSVPKHPDQRPQPEPEQAKEEALVEREIELAEAEIRAGKAGAVFLGVAKI